MAKIQAVLLGERIFSNDEEARTLHEKMRLGEKEKEKILYMNEEALFLVEKGKMDVLNSSYKKIIGDELLKKLVRIDKRFFVKYSVFKDLRKKGLIVKSGFKFGSDFRVYEKGVKMGRGHSRWVCFCEADNKSLSWQEFASKNRVAHSTKKKLLIAVVDSENDVSYYESGWKRIA
jgi:tRNA-intron endonuclease, archaea type